MQDFEIVVYCDNSIVATFKRLEDAEDFIEYKKTISDKEYKIINTTDNQLIDLQMQLNNATSLKERIEIGQKIVDIKNSEVSSKHKRYF